jgi:hypothetical protein
LCFSHSLFASSVPQKDRNLFQAMRQATVETMCTIARRFDHESNGAALSECRDVPGSLRETLEIQLDEYLDKTGDWSGLD